jgi:hypothetical protein
MNCDGFLYAKSEGHYVNIFYKIRIVSIVRSGIVRSSMIKLGVDVFGNCASITRVHKSYFVNLNHVKSLRVLPNTKSGVFTLSILNITLPLGKSKLSGIMSFIEVSQLDIIIY